MAGATSFRLALGGTVAAAPEFPQDWSFGNVRITKIVDVVEPFDAARAFPGAPLEVFEQQADWIPPYFYDPVHKAIIFSFHSYLLRAPGLTMIVDTGFGEDSPLRPQQHRGSWLSNLAAAGVTPADVNVVTCTHFHSDHIGWNTRQREGQWTPTFPNARYLFNRAEIDDVESRSRADARSLPAFQQSILPILQSSQVHRFDGDFAVSEEVRIVPTPGHTPGHQNVEIRSKGRRAVLAGDILHSPIEVLHPEWTNLFDEDKAAAMAQRVRFLDAHTDVDITIFAAHFAGPTAGRIVSDHGRRIFRTLVT
jgi:glyoxylase-like metal-dependent hydrolase (beta-lactamase superfamily II)